MFVFVKANPVLRLRTPNGGLIRWPLLNPIISNPRPMKINSSREILFFGGFWSLFAICLATAAAGPLEPWATRYVGASTISGVAYGGGVYVAAGDVCYTSPDTICWTRKELDPVPQNGLSGIAYGNGRFVAIEPSPWHQPGSAYVSTNGMSWQRSGDLPGNSVPVIQRIHFGGGVFLAVGQEPNPLPESGKHWLVMTSADGISWERHSGPTNNAESHYLNAATYGNGLYVVGGFSGLPAQQGLVVISTDLANWTQVSGFPFPVINGVAFGNGSFVAVGGGNIATSTNGVQWTTRLSVGQGILRAVAFGGNRFVAVGEPHLLLSSTNGIDWDQHASSVDGFLDVTYGSGSFVAAGGFYTAIPRGVAVQSEGRPQVCLEALGFFQPGQPGFGVLLTAEGGRTYRLQSSPILPAVSWTDVDSVTLPAGPWPPTVQMIDATAPPAGQRFYQAVSP